MSWSQLSYTRKATDCILLIATLLTSQSGCSPLVYITKSGREVVSIAEGGMACVAGMEEVLSLYKSQRLSYVGTSGRYHIIKWWTKVLPHHDACLTYAVPDVQFTPRYPFKYLGSGEYIKHPRSPLPGDDEDGHRGDLSIENTK